MNGVVGKGVHEVKFIDFGNVEKVKTEDLLKLPAHLLAFEPQAIKCAFAYIRTPSVSKQCGNEAAKYVQKFGLNNTHDAIVAYEAQGHLLVTLVEVGEEDQSNSLNAYLVSEGLAIMDKTIKSDELPEDVITWEEF